MNLLELMLLYLTPRFFQDQLIFLGCATIVGVDPIFTESQQ